MKMIHKKIVDQNIASLSDYLDDYREDYELRKNASARTVVEMYLDDQCIRIHYPEVIQ